MSRSFQLGMSLPDEPLIRIRSGRVWTLIDLRDVWAHSELFYFLVWRDLKVRYKQTILGASWVILQPLLMTVIFVVFLGLIVRVHTPGVPYPLFLYSALLPWTFFSNAVASSSYSLIAASQVITKVYFPRVLIPAAVVTVRLSDFVIAFVFLIPLIAYYGVRPTWTLVFLPLLVVLITLLALGVGLWSAALNVKYRDVGTIIPVLLQLWMFVSPVVYPSSMVPARWRIMYNFNPLAGLINNFRSSLTGTPFNGWSLAISAVITVVVLGSALIVFRRVEDEFADLI